MLYYTHTFTNINTQTTREKVGFYQVCQVNCLYVANAPTYLSVKIVPNIISVLCLCRIFMQPQLQANPLTMLLLLLYQYCVCLTQWHNC